MLKKSVNALNSGIYQIINKVNCKFYIGSSVELSKRFSRHKRELQNNKHPNKKLQNSWNKYGKNAFEFKIILFCPRELCIKLEQYCLDSLNPSLNILKNAKSRLGVKHTEKAKKKISESNMGKVMSKESTEKRLNTLKQLKKEGKLHYSHKGVKKSDETRKRMSNSMKGVPKKFNRKVDYDKIIKLVSQGFSTNEIANILGVNKKAVGQVRWRLGINVNKLKNGL